MWQSGCKTEGCNCVNMTNMIRLCMDKLLFGLQKKGQRDWIAYNHVVTLVEEHLPCMYNGSKQSDGDILGLCMFLKC